VARRDFRRRAPTRDVGQKVIIACEGTTERRYFNDIRAARRLAALKVILVQRGTDPRGVVRAAINEREEHRSERNWDAEIDTTWAVYDGDEHRANDPTNWHEALDLARGNSIRLAISNPSFEFWYLLHFHDQQAYLTREQALRLLKSHAPDYHKTTSMFPDPLQPLTRTAIERARALEARAIADSLPAHENPCTGVADLVELLLSLT